jgi:hypothetical protein
MELFDAEIILEGRIRIFESLRIWMDNLLTTEWGIDIVLLREANE